MKVLVFDDSRANRDAAHAQLKGHDLTVVGTYDEAQKLLMPKLDHDVASYPDFDVVLTDLLVPASRQEQGGDGLGFVGQEMPVGIFIGLLAAKAHVKYVGVFTDSGHHDHPASACFDAFSRSELEPTPLLVEGSKVILCNNRNWIRGAYESKEGRVKNWARLLDYLVKE